MNIDMRSAVVGAVLGAIVVAAIGAATQPGVQPEPTVTPIPKDGAVFVIDADGYGWLIQTDLGNTPIPAWLFNKDDGSSSWPNFRNSSLYRVQKKGEDPTYPRLEAWMKQQPPASEPPK